MTLGEFTTEINNELSQDCQIPFQIHTNSIMREVKWSKKWFHRHYEYSVEDAYVLVNSSAFETEEFKNNKRIKLNEDIIQVYNVTKMNNARGRGDFSIDRLNAHQLYRTASGPPGRRDLNLTYFMASQMMYDWINRLFTHTVTYDYNPTSRNLIIMGEVPSTDLILTCSKSISDEELFEDEKFYRYVVARCKVNLARILGTIQMELIGGATIDFDGLKSEGQEEITELKEEIENQEGVDYFFEK